ncbi:peptidyl-prolyl cis-trans isomerase [Spirochaetia bacterium]|nr:peptidyl-prolyl cis-trans isomerase [Spirochaetia bacterium]
MKRTLFFALAVLVLIGCKGGGKADPANAGDAGIAGNALDKDTSYALGMTIAANIRDSADFTLDVDGFSQGIRDLLSGKKTRLTQEEAAEKVQAAFDAIAERESAPLKQAEADFLAANAAKAGIQTTGSGLQYEVISEGTGPKPQATDTVEVHYEGTLISGEVFDSSYDRGETTTFPLDRVIPGWTEGIQLMNVGSNYRFFIPSNLGYGEQGAGGVIPPFSTLIFNVELISIVAE